MDHKKDMDDRRSLFVSAAPGLEDVLLDELRTLSLPELHTVEGGVELDVSLPEIRRVNLRSRVATRALLRVASFRAPSFRALERGAVAVDWSPYLPPDARVLVRASTRGSRLANASHVARAIFKVLKSTTGAHSARSTLDDDALAEEAQLIFVRVVDDRCTVSVDTSGALLHRRGYRRFVGRAPLRETIAAGVLRLAGWTPDSPLFDPMCGSGTFAIEAALTALAVAPGAHRAFAFERWPSHDEAAWHKERDEAEAERRAAPLSPIVATDADPRATTSALANATAAGVEAAIQLRQADIDAIEPPDGPPGLVVCNPPFGDRLGSPAEARRLYARLGAVLTRRFGGWRAAILAPERRLERELRLLVTARQHIVTGGKGVDVVLAAL